MKILQLVIDRDQFGYGFIFYVKDPFVLKILINNKKLYSISFSKHSYVKIRKINDYFRRDKDYIIRRIK